ncbi:phosphoesterase [Candidatus Laterigemmans baculatus]|uniref:phosphoesterase n=1 Tax=Candidatus Laterigemmans baculatus TaxID=2770505 RepID=UPI0013DB67D4|nr:phosphoesterase [Candidatus Laterigemmans baculatus]
MPAHDEQILVIPAAVVERIAPFEGFTTEVDRYLEAILNDDSLEFRPRSEMELDPSFKQLIPYVILRHTDATGVPRIFNYTRGSGQGEARLHARRSIGIGGHISSEDAAPPDDRHDYGPYRNGMLRELAEEVQLNSAYEEHCVGLIYDSSTEVGRVHLGVVHIFELAEARVEANEEDICDPGFVTVDELRRDREQLEIWSRLCLDSLLRE